MHTLRSLSLAKIHPLRAASRDMRKGKSTSSLAAGRGARPLWSPRTGHNTSPDLCCPAPRSHTTLPSSGGPEACSHCSARLGSRCVREAQEGRAPQAGVGGPWQRWVLKEGPLVNPLSWEPAVQAARGPWPMAREKVPVVRNSRNTVC